MQTNFSGLDISVELGKNTRQLHNQSPIQASLVFLWETSAANIIHLSNFPLAKQAKLTSLAKSNFTTLRLLDQQRWPRDV